MADSMWDWFGKGAVSADSTRSFDDLRTMVKENQLDPIEVVQRLVELVEAESTTENNFVPADILQQMTAQLG